MWVIFILLLQVQPEPFKVSLEDHDLFQPIGLIGYQVGTNVLIVSTMDNRMVLFDQKGKAIAHYDKTGKGPGELFRIAVLGVDDRHIWLVSNHTNVLRFDFQLNLVAEPAPHLPFEIGMSRPTGFIVSENRFTVVHHDVGAFGVEVLTPGKNDWLIQKQWFKRANPQPFTKEFIRAHHGVYFLSEYQVPLGETSYSVRVFKKPEREFSSENVDNLLSGRVDMYPPLFDRFHVVLDKMVVLPHGFMVSFVTASDQRQFHHWWDYFGADGGFVKRVDAGGQVLVPMVNSTAVFAVVNAGDHEFLVRLDENGMPLI